MAAADCRMRLTVLGGFLGSGKTTWLRHQLHHGSLKDAFVVVNEVAETPVDGVLLQGSPRLAVLAGGCACCEIRSELLALLREIADANIRDESARPGVVRILLETSGLADPGSIVEGIRADPVLVHHILVSDVVVAVDGVYGLEQLRREPLGRRQVEVADRLVVTKIDVADDTALTHLLATLHMLNPGAEISGAIRGSEASLPAVGGAAVEALPELSGAVAMAPIFATKLSMDDPIDWTAFSIWLSALLHARGDDILRVKGVVRTPSGRLLLQSVRRIVQSPEILPDDEPANSREDNNIVVIGRGYASQDLFRSLRYFACGGTSAA
jgi:G3E family GTPase